MQISGYNLNDFWLRDGRSIKTGTWNIPEHSSLRTQTYFRLSLPEISLRSQARNIPEHPGTPNNYDNWGNLKKSARI